MKTVNNSHVTILVIVACVLFLVSVLFVGTYKRLHTGGVFKSHRSHPMLHNADAIQSWMTFDYVNHTFKIPDSYFKEVFAITSREYPKITIKKVAKTQGKDSSLFLLEVRKSLRDYMTLIAPIDAKP